MVELSATPKRFVYGHPIGILMLNCRVPFVPGDVGNASSFRYPVLFSEVEGATIEKVVLERSPEIAGQLVDRAKFLADQGVRAITSNCGYFGFFQEAVAAELDVPVFLSSLMQVPLLRASLGPHRQLGIIAASERTFDAKLLDSVGLADATGLVVAGLDDSPHFQQAMMKSAVPLVPETLEDEVVAVAVEMQRVNPNLGAIMLECSDLPPYAAEVHKATGLPVFDWIGFADYIAHAVTPSRYSGIF